jgi:hypothetical protein
VYCPLKPQLPPSPGTSKKMFRMGRCASAPYLNWWAPNVRLSVSPHSNWFVFWNFGRKSGEPSRPRPPPAAGCGTPPPPLIDIPGNPPLYAGLSCTPRMPIPASRFLAGSCFYEADREYGLGHLIQVGTDQLDTGGPLGRSRSGDYQCGSVPQLPKELLMLLEHFIISHHGQLQYGSPEPRFPEASSSTLSTTSMRKWRPCARLWRAIRPSRNSGPLEFTPWDTRYWMRGDSWTESRTCPKDNRNATALRSRPRAAFSAGGAAEHGSIMTTSG